MAEVQLLKIASGVLTRHSVTADSARFSTVGVGVAAPTSGLATTGAQVHGITGTPITANYSIAADDSTVVTGTLTASITITLPASPATGRVLYIKDGGGYATTYNIVVSGNGNNVDGSSTYTLRANRASIQIQYHATLGWLII